MRDPETVGAALTAANTGHLVFSTLHTVDATETVNRIVDFFPPHQHQQVRAMLAGTLKGVISQRLVPTIDHSGRAAACEVLTMTGRVRDMIMDPNETGKLSEVIAEGVYYGMTTFDQSLFNLYREGTISLKQALGASTHPHDFKLLVASEGQRSTSVTHLYAGDDEENSREPAAAQPAQHSAPQPTQPPAEAPPVDAATPAQAPVPPARPAPEQSAPAPESAPAPHPPNGGAPPVSLAPPGVDRDGR
jgi:twitching motility protein PilT